MKIVFFERFAKNTQISNFMKIRPVGAALPMPYTRIDRMFILNIPLRYIYGSSATAINTTVFILRYIGIRLNVSTARGHHHPLKY